MLTLIHKYNKTAAIVATQSLNDRFDKSEAAQNARNDETNRRLDSRFAMLLTAMIALTGVIVATIKL